MKNFIYLTQIILFFCFTTVNAQNPPARYAHSMDKVGDKIYLYGGEDDVSMFWLSDFWEYSYNTTTETGTWVELEPIGDIPPATGEHSTIVYKDELYIIGGKTVLHPNEPSKALAIHKYSPSTNEWTNIPFELATAPREMYGQATEVIGDKMYLSYQEQMWSFNLLTCVWEKLADSPYYDEALMNFRWHSTAVYGNNFYVVRGGMGTDGNVYIYNTGTNSWSMKETDQTDFAPQNVWSAAAWSDGERVFMAGGRLTDSAVLSKQSSINTVSMETLPIDNSFCYYDLLDNKWISIDPLTHTVYKYDAEIAPIPNVQKTLIQTGGLDKSGEKSDETELIKYELKEDKENVNLYTLVLPDDAASDGCSVSPESGSYLKNSSVNLQAIKADGWVFMEWTGDVSGSSPNVEILMDTDKDAVANFQPILELTLTSPEASNHCPPSKLNYDLHIATASIFVDGVDWQLNGINFSAIGKAKAGYTEAVLLVRGKEYKGSIKQDADKNISTVSFALNEIIKEGSTLPLMLYYRFNIPSKSEKTYLAGAINEVKTMGVSTNITQLNCLPIPEPARPGVKSPLKEQGSNIQTMASIWNNFAIPSLPFTTIQEAIDDPKTNNGDYIDLCPGYYKYETPINISKSITLFGKGSDNTFIEGNNSEVILITASKSAVIECCIENKKAGKGTFDRTYGIKSIYGIDQLRFSLNKFICSKYQTGIHIEGARTKDNLDTNFTIINNSFLQNTNLGLSVGVYLFNANSAIVRENIFENFFQGIDLVSSNYAYFYSNLFMGTYNPFTISYSRYTLILQNEIVYHSNSSIAFVDVQHPRFIGNKFTGHSTVLKYEKCNYAYISQNLLNNANHIFTVEMLDSDNAEIKGQDNLQLNINTKENFLSKLHKINRNKNFHSIKLSNVYKSEMIFNECNNSDNAKCFTPIFLENCADIKVVSNKLYNRENTAIKINESTDINITSNLFHKITNEAISITGNDKPNPKFSITKNKIFHNKENIAIYISAMSSVIDVFANDIYSAQTGLRIDYVKKGKVLLNLFNNNGTAIECLYNDDVNILRNVIRESTHTLTGIHLEGSMAKIEGNNLLKNNGAAVGLWKNSSAEIIGNNFIDNPGLAIYNEMGSTVSDAGHNYWGSSSPPDSNIFDGDFSVTSWLIKPITLIVDALADSVKTATGKSDSVSIAIANYINSNDEIELTIIDEKGWLLNGGKQSLTLADSSFSILDIKYEIPADAESSFSNKVKISAVSKTNSEQTAVDSFYILNYTPQIAGFRIYPDSITISTNDTLQLSASPIDQYSKDFIGEYNISWSVSAGSINSTGLFVAPSEESIVTIEVTENISGVKSSTQLSVLTNPYLPETIVITPDSLTLKPESSIQFFAHGIDKHGFSISVDCEWTTTAGIIDSTGLLTTTANAGNYTVTAADKNSEISATAYIIILQPTGIVEEKIIPSNYSLNQNYPNPFNPTTNIKFGLPFDSNVKLHVYNILGQKVATLTENKILSAGNHTKIWNASTLSSGVYFLVMDARSISSNKEFHSVKKMLLLR